jgi:hypothetical protein
MALCRRKSRMRSPSPSPDSSSSPLVYLPHVHDVVGESRYHNGLHNMSQRQPLNDLPSSATPFIYRKSPLFSPGALDPSSLAVKILFPSGMILLSGSPRTRSSSPTLFAVTSPVWMQEKVLYRQARHRCSTSAIRDDVEYLRHTFGGFSRRRCCFEVLGTNRGCQARGMDLDKDGYYESSGYLSRLTNVTFQLLGLNYRRR